MAVQSLALLGNLIGVTWLYSVVEDYVYITIRSLATHITALVLMFIFVHDQNDYVFYAATTVVANAGANIFNFFHVKKYVKVRITTHFNLKKHLKPVLIIFASTVTTTIYVNSDTTILGFLAGDYYVGLYSTAVKVYTVLKSCIAAVILVSLPRLSNYLASGRKDDFKQTANRIFKMFTMILLPIVIGIMMTSDAIIHVIAGPSYAEAALSLRILSISLIFSMLATYFTNAVLLPYNQEITVLRGTVMSGIINVVLNFILLAQFKQNGAAFTTVIAEMFIFVYQYIYARKLLKIELDKKYILSVAVGCVGIVVTCIVIDFVVSVFALNLILKITLSILIYAVALLVLKNDVAASALQSIIIKLRYKRD